MVSDSASQDLRQGSLNSHSETFRKLEIKLLKRVDMIGN